MYGLAIAFDVAGDFWDKETSVKYDERSFIVESGRVGEAHTIRTTYDHESEYRNAFRSAAHFLNELAWNYQLGISITTCVHGNGTPRTGDRSNRERNTRLAIHDSCQKVRDERSHLALGCYREALDSNSPFYRFLSYFRVLEVAIPDGKERGIWVEKCVLQLKHSKQSIALLKRARVEDVGKWLYLEGRHALAHASGKDGGTVRDICSFDDWQTIVWANEIVEELAYTALIEHLKVDKPTHA